MEKIFLKEGEISSLENEIQSYLKNKEDRKLKVLGYGEICLVIGYPYENTQYACKRLPPFPNRKSAEQFKESIIIYQRKLKSLGINIIPSQVIVIRSQNGDFILYLIQPNIANRCVDLIKFLPRIERNNIVKSIFEQIAKSCSPTLAIDGQLSNWAWIDGKAVLFDISTPFMKDDQLESMLNVNVILNQYPAFIKPYLKKWVVPGVLEKYHSLRGNLLDFLGNLHKEGLEDCIPDSIDLANQYLESKISLKNVYSYYRMDAFLWEFIYLLKKVNYLWITKIKRSTCNFLLSPPTERKIIKNLGKANV